METLISDKFLFNSPLPSLSQFKFTSNSLKVPSSPQFPTQNRNLNPKPPNFSSISSPNSTIYGGWEELLLTEDPKHSGNSPNSFQQFLVSVGIDDRKHVLMFVIGFVSALAISRVRVSSILVFPASVLVFGVGFSLGFVRNSWLSSSGRNGSKKGFKDENFRGSSEKVRSLVDIFSGLDGKITNLEEKIRGGMEIEEFESYYSVIKSLSMDLLRAKELAEELRGDMDGLGSVGDGKVELVDNGEKILKVKVTARKRDHGASYFDVFQFFGGLFQENVVKSNKVKDTSKQELAESLSLKDVNSQSHGSDVVGGDGSEIGKRMNDSSRDQILSQNGSEMLGDEDGKMDVIMKMVNGHSTKMVNDIERLATNHNFFHQDNSSHLVDSYRNFMKRRRDNENELLDPRDDFVEPLDVGVDMKSREIDLRSCKIESQDSLEEEQAFTMSDRASMPHYSRKKGENASYVFNSKEDPPKLGSPVPGYETDDDSAMFSSVISEDVVFDKHLTEATDLLKQAREYLKGKVEEERAEVILYKSARLLNRAIAMKPMSLLAVGQLGNVYLLHGELKLRIARQLRSLLSKRDSLYREGNHRIQIKGLDDQVISRDRIASNLVDVCEECEELLLEAGRKYKMALSIDGSDVRALYNWGLALSYRAQLIADIGPGAAADADRVYMAAVDKFDAMMSRSNASAPNALFRWGVALQQRSRLRPSNSKAKVKLLHQAKRLFEDALGMDSNNVEVREALSSCVSELNHKHSSY